MKRASKDLSVFLVSLAFFLLLYYTVGLNNKGLYGDDYELFFESIALIKNGIKNFYVIYSLPVYALHFLAYEINSLFSVNLGIIIVYSIIVSISSLIIYKITAILTNRSYQRSYLYVFSIPIMFFGIGYLYELQLVKLFVPILKYFLHSEAFYRVHMQVFDIVTRGGLTFFIFPPFGTMKNCLSLLVFVILLYTIYKSSPISWLIIGILPLINIPYLTLASFVLSIVWFCYNSVRISSKLLLLFSLSYFTSLSIALVQYFIVTSNIDIFMLYTYLFLYLILIVITKINSISTIISRFLIKVLKIIISRVFVYIMTFLVIVSISMFYVLVHMHTGYWITFSLVPAYYHIPNTYIALLLYRAVLRRSFHKSPDLCAPLLLVAYIYISLEFIAQSLLIRMNFTLFMLILLNIIYVTALVKYFSYNRNNRIRHIPLLMIVLSLIFFHYIGFYFVHATPPTRYVPWNPEFCPSYGTLCKLEKETSNSLKCFNAIVIYDRHYPWSNLAIWYAGHLFFASKPILMEINNIELSKLPYITQVLGRMGVKYIIIVAPNETLYNVLNIIKQKTWNFNFIYFTVNLSNTYKVLVIVNKETKGYCLGAGRALINGVVVKKENVKIHNTKIILSKGMGSICDHMIYPYIKYLISFSDHASIKIIDWNQYIILKVNKCSHITIREITYENLFYEKYRRIVQEAFYLYYILPVEILLKKITHLM